MFNSPDQLRKFILNVADRMCAEGLSKQAQILEHRVNLVCTTGREWLDELSKATNLIKSQAQIPELLTKDLDVIYTTCTSPKPYRE